MQSKELASIQPGYGDRAIFVGKTGSGKSVLEKALLACQTLHDDVLIIDNKHEIFAKNAEYITKPSEYAKRNEGLIIYHPDTEYDNIAAYEDLLKLVYLRRHTLLGIDELYAVCDDRGNAPPHLRAIYTRGRSLGLSVYACTQRPVWVPIYTLSETNNRYIFTLDYEPDRKRMAGIVGKEGEEQIPEYQFLFTRNGVKPELLKYNMKTKRIEVIDNG